MTTAGRRNQGIETLTVLLERAELQGYLTTDDLMEVCPDVSHDNERFEAILHALRRRGVDILDQADTDELAEEDDLENTREFNPYADLSPISSDDTIGLYLKEMARVPLLNMIEEVDLAKRIESGKEANKEMIRHNGDCPPELRLQL